jgi:hypothetical protein
MTNEGNLPTRIHRGPIEAPLPVLAGVGSPTEVEAYERAPTLMGGSAPGSQGDVRVWSPSRKGLWISTIGFGAGAILMLALIILTRSAGGFAWMIGSLMGGFGISLSALRRPGYITTDGAGIGITTRKGSRAVRWHEIESAQLMNVGSFGQSCMLELRVPDKVSANLSGYSVATRNELLGLVTRRAGLIQDHKRRRLWKRKAAAELPPGASSPEGSWALTAGEQHGTA